MRSLVILLGCGSLTLMGCGARRMHPGPSDGGFVEPTSTAAHDGAPLPADADDRADADLPGSGDATPPAGGDTRPGDPGPAGDPRPAADPGLAADPGPGDPGPIDDHIDIYVDNFCNLWVVPPEVLVPSGIYPSFEYHNNSVDYEVDVWLSYGGGYLELATGAIWDDRFEFCHGNRPYNAAADISISGLGVNDPYCPGHRMLIHCQ